MTAAHQRPNLEIVPDPDDTVDLAPTPEGSDWRAESIIDQYSPEHQLIGSLMWLTAETARPLLDLVPDTAIWRPQTRWAYELIRRVVDDGNAPTPPAVLAAGRRHAASDALDPHRPPTAEQHRHLAVYLFDAYSQALAPTTATVTYAREVLDEAYRRAFRENGIRMQQLAECDVERELLTKLFFETRDELAELWRRSEAAQAFTSDATATSTPVHTELLERYGIPVHAAATAERNRP